MQFLKFWLLSLLELIGIAVICVLVYMYGGGLELEEALPNAGKCAIIFWIMIVCVQVMRKNSAANKEIRQSNADKRAVGTAKHVTYTNGSSQKGYSKKKRK